jgi:glutaconyl-CoA/methylmalonyl-CoA decarboxylase subunit gamma
MYIIEFNGKAFAIEVNDTCASIVETKTMSDQMDSDDLIDSLGEIPDLDFDDTEDVSTDVLASMPGTVIQICVSVGDNVKEGTVLAVVESMKMENEVVASMEGTVAEILIKPGNRIEKGQSILKIAN